MGELKGRPHCKQTHEEKGAEAEEEEEREEAEMEEGVPEVKEGEAVEAWVMVAGVLGMSVGEVVVVGVVDVAGVVVVVGVLFFLILSGLLGGGGGAMMLLGGGGVVNTIDSALASPANRPPRLARILFFACADLRATWTAAFCSSERRSWMMSIDRSLPWVT